MYGCESWAIKRLNAEELMLSYWCCRRLLRVPRTAMRSKQSTLKEINPDYSLKGLVLKLKLRFGHLMRRADSLEKTLMLWKIEGKKKSGCRGSGRGEASDRTTSALYPGEASGNVCHVVVGMSMSSKASFLLCDVRQMTKPLCIPVTSAQTQRAHVRFSKTMHSQGCAHRKSLIN